MATQIEQLLLKSEVERIVEALFTLPADKVTAVRDYVWFLQAQYGQPALDVSDEWSEQDIADLSAATVAYAERALWAEDDGDPTW